jgi:hypothetical protein
MGTRVRSATANVLGVLALIYLVFLWTIVLNPVKWNLSFPGGLSAGFITMLLAILASVVAGIWGKRAWLVVAGAATLTFIYIGFVEKMPFVY